MVSRVKHISPIDGEIGGRVRAARIAAGLSQEKLGEAVGITFQQIQKYEKGINRIGGSRMKQIATVLRVPISYFFADESDVDGDALDVLGPLVGMSRSDIALAQAVADLGPEATRIVWQIVQLMAAGAGRAAIPVEKMPARRADVAARGPALVS